VAVEVVDQVEENDRLVLTKMEEKKLI